MANLTLAIEDELLRAARIKAVQQGTSVNEICREAITRFIAPAVDSRDFLSELRAVVARLPKSTAAEPAWPGREALYEGALAERLPTLWTGMELRPATAAAVPTPGSAAQAGASEEQQGPTPT